MKMNKTKLRHDFLVLVLDIIAINLAYFLALAARVAINDAGGIFSSAGDVPGYFAAFYKFAPFYTALCVAVFFFFRLYSGVWRYAGANDMQRILLASLVTCVIQVVGSVLFVRRMPIGYYILGALFQCFFVTSIRFARKIVGDERKKRSKKSASALVVGAGELGMQTVQILQSGDEFRVDCIVDTENEHVGKMLNGVPVYSLDQLSYTLENHDIRCVFLAEPHLSEEQKRTIAKTCEEFGIELRAQMISSGKGASEQKPGSLGLNYVTISYSDDTALSQEDAWLQSILSGSSSNKKQ